MQDFPGLNIGEYLISIQRLNEPVGCATLSFGDDATPGRIDPAGDIDCFRFTGAARDRVRVRLLKASDAGFNPSAEVLRADGGPLPGCGPTGIDDFTCRLRDDGLHTILVQHSAGLNTGDYLISIQLDLASAYA